jgi:hypothetical protein
MTKDHETTICELLRSTGRKGMEELICWMKSGKYAAFYENFGKYE